MAPSRGFALGLALLILGLAIAALGSGWWAVTHTPSELTQAIGQTVSTNSAPATLDAEYVKKSGLFLVSTTPGPGNPSEKVSIFTTRPDGTRKTVLADDGGAPSWTPDGRIIFVSSRTGSPQIWIMDEDGGGAKQIGVLPPTLLHPLMPQLGKNGLVAFMAMTPSSKPEENIGIYVMRHDGSGLKEIAQGMQPFLAPSGTWIAYTYQTEDPYHRQIWRINTDGSGKKQLTFLGDPDYPDGNAPSISPDEKWIAFFSGKESDKMTVNPNQSIFTWGHRNVAIMPAEGGPRKTLTPCRPVTTEAELRAATPASGKCIAADNPAWTPDGKWLVFDTGFFAPGSPGTETWLVDLNGEHFQPFYAVSRGIVRVPIKYK